MRFSLHLSIFIAFLLNTVAFADELPSLLTDGYLLRIADSFFDEGEYYRAITEYKRFLYTFPNSTKADYAQFRIGYSLYRGKKFTEALQAFSLFSDKYPSSTLIANSHYMEGICYWKTGNTREANIKFDTVIDFFAESTFRSDAIKSKALIALDQNDTKEATKQVELLKSLFQEASLTKQADSALKALSLYEDRPHKSPALAGIMSAIVPGSGYFYAERYGDGTSAFLINALFITGTVTAINQRNYPTAYIVGAFGLPFYIGNIYGSANAARKWNVGIRKDLHDTMYFSLDFEIP